MRRDQNGTSYIYIQDIKPGSPSDKDGRLKYVIKVHQFGDLKNKTCDIKI